MNAVIIMQPSSAHSSNIFLVRSNIFQFAPPAVKTKWTYCNLTVIAELFYISFCLQQPGTFLGSQGPCLCSRYPCLLIDMTFPRIFQQPLQSVASLLLGHGISNFCICVDICVDNIYTFCICGKRITETSPQFISEILDLRQYRDNKICNAVRVVTSRDTWHSGHRIT